MKLLLVGGGGVSYQLMHAAGAGNVLEDGFVEEEDVCQDISAAHLSVIIVNYMSKIEKL